MAVMQAGFCIGDIRLGNRGNIAAVGAVAVLIEAIAINKTKKKLIGSWRTWSAFFGAIVILF